MKAFTHFRLGLLATAILFHPSSFILAQGPLTPPGAPAPAMKTLDQVEARTPLAGGTSPVSIGSGSYYLTGNLTVSTGANGITVTASNVTIDLNGFTLTGPTSVATGIYLNGGVSNVTIVNGTIRNWGSDGINAVGNPHVRAEKVRIISNGGAGIDADVNAEVISCVAESNVGAGIRGTDNCLVKDTQVLSTTGVNSAGILLGAAAIVTGCIARGNSGDGIAPGQGSIVSDCLAYNNTLNGILVADGCTVKSCNVRSNSSNGIKAGSDCELVQNHCSNNGTTSGATSTDAGIYVTGYSNLIDANTLSNNHDIGVRVYAYSSLNVIIRNIAIGHSPNYTVFGGNDIAPRGNVTDSTNPWLNIND